MITFEMACQQVGYDSELPEPDLRFHAGKVENEAEIEEFVDEQYRLRDMAVKVFRGMIRSEFRSEYSHLTDGQFESIWSMAERRCSWSSDAEYDEFYQEFVDVYEFVIEFNSAKTV